MTGPNDRVTTGDQQQDKATAQAQADHLSNFFDEYFKTTNAKDTKVASAKPGDANMERVNATQTTPKGDARDPYTYTTAAAEAAQEMVKLNQSNDNSPEANARRQQLQETIRQQMEEAKKRADAIAQKGDNGVESLLADFNKNKNAQREQLATQLGLDPRTTSTQEIMQKFGNGGVAADTMSKAEDLFKLQSEYESLNKLRLAPAVVRTQYADLIGHGFLEPNAAKVGVDQQPGPISQTNAIDAYRMIREAANTGDNNEVKNNPDFQRVSYQTTMQYADFQNQRCKDIAEGLHKADEFTKAGKTKEAEDQYKEALKKAESIDLKFVLQQMQDPRNQQNEQVRNGFMQIAMATEGARFEYARFLNQQGRHDEALPLLIKIQADPIPTQNDKNFNDQMSIALHGKDAASSTDSPQIHMNNFQAAMERKDYATASQEIATAKALAAKQVNPDLIEKETASLEKSKKEIENQKKALEAKTDMSADDKALEKSRLDNQLGLMSQYEANMKNNKNSLDYINYLDGYCDYLKGDNDSAHAKLEAFKNANPELAKKDEMKMDDLLEATRHKGWFERNIKGILIGTALVVGAVATVATFGAFAPAEAGLLTLAAGAGALAVGTAAGATAFTVGTATLNQKDWKGWGTVAEGAKWAALGSSFVLAPEIGAAMPAVLGVSGTAATLASYGARALVMGVPQVTTNAAIEVTQQNKDWGTAFADQANMQTAATFAFGGFAPKVIGGSLFSKLLIAAPAAVPIGMDAYTQVRNTWHYPLDPNDSSDRQEMAEREAAHRAAQQMPLVTDGQ